MGGDQANATANLFRSSLLPRRHASDCRQNCAGARTVAAGLPSSSHGNGGSGICHDRREDLESAIGAGTLGGNEEADDYVYRGRRWRGDGAGFCVPCADVRREAEPQAGGGGEACGGGKVGVEAAGCGGSVGMEVGP